MELSTGSNKPWQEITQGVSSYYVNVALFATLAEQQVRGEREPPHYQMNCSASGISDRQIIFSVC